MRILLSALAALIGLSVAFGAAAQAEPTSPTPGPTITSTDDELVDMVLDAVHQGAGAPTTSVPVPPP